MIEFEKAVPVEIVYPDQAPGELGTLFIPNTVAIIKGGPHPDAARRLVDYLLSPPVEIGLAEGDGGQIPLNSTVNMNSASRPRGPSTRWRSTSSRRPPVGRGDRVPPDEFGGGWSGGLGIRD